MSENSAQQPASEFAHHLIRELGLKEGIAIGLGTMIGAGIFVLSALAAERAGPASTISYVIAGLICLPIALVVSELATGMPRAGGSYTFITEAMGPLAGSVVGPGNWLGLTFASGFYLLACGEYISLVVPIPPWVSSLVVGLLFTVLNYRGAKLTGSVQNFVVVILVVILLVFVGVGFFQINTRLYTPFAPLGWGVVIGNVGLIIVSFTGFEKISTISEEMKNPGRNLPLAIIGSVVIATILYACILLVLTGTFPRIGIAQRDAPLVEAAGQMVGPFGTSAMLAAAILATLSSANAAIMASSRINYGMGRDGVLPGWFNHIHHKHNTPSRSILVTGALGIGLSLIGQAETLAEISSALFMVSYALLCLSVVVMRHSRPPWYKPAFRVPLYPVLPVVGGLLCLTVIFTMAPDSRAAGLGLVFASLVWYVVWVRRKANVEGEFGPLWARERPLEGVIQAAADVAHPDGTEIIIPLLGDADLGPVVRLATRLAQADDQHMLVLTQINVLPPQTPLDFAERRFQGQAKGTQIEALVQQAGDADIPMRVMRHAAHGLASGVLAVTGLRETVDLILLDWHGPLSAGQIYGHPNKMILQEAHCNVAVLRERNLDRIRRILIPAGGGPHARYGLRLAARLAHQGDVQLTLLRVTRPSAELNMEVEERALKDLAEDVIGDMAAQVEIKVVVHADVVEPILEEAQAGGYDLLIIGASNEWMVKSLLVGAIPDTIADRAPCSVLMVRRFEPTGIFTIRRIIRSVRG